jgi:hypothetical protein
MVSGVNKVNVPGVDMSMAFSSLVQPSLFPFGKIIGKMTGDLFLISIFRIIGIVLFFRVIPVQQCRVDVPLAAAK